MKYGAQGTGDVPVKSSLRRAAKKRKKGKAPYPLRPLPSRTRQREAAKLGMRSHRA